MAFTLGTIEQFTGQDLDLYAERLEEYLIANKVDTIALKEDGSNKTEVENRDKRRRAVLDNSH